MARRSTTQPPPIEPRIWSTKEEIERAIVKLRRRISELENLDVAAAYLHKTAEDDVAVSNFQETIREVFGQNSPEFREHEHTHMHSGVVFGGMSDGEYIEGLIQGKTRMIGVLKGLIGRLNEKAEELGGSSALTPKAYLHYLNLHPRIEEVASELFEDGHYMDAVFAASKALVNYVKDRSGKHDLDGAGLMTTVFSPKNPILAFNDLANQTDLDEQQGMMHLFVGVVLGIRNPGGHSFPAGDAQRAVEYLSLISLLAYRTKEARKI
jgi:uncharacterized protein (TIGR02391 family)